MAEKLKHDASTLVKVREALVGCGFTYEQADRAIWAIQSFNIVFREPVK